MLKNIARIIVIFCALLLLAAGVLLVAFHLIFSGDRLKSMAVNGLRGYTMRDASVDRLSAGLSGIEGDGLALSEFPNFQAGTFLSLRRLSVRFRPLALLKHRLVINAVHVDAPKLTVTFYKDATTSFSNLLGPSLPRQYAPLALLVTGCRVADGEVRIKDERWHRLNLAVRNITLEIPEITLSAPVSFHIAGDTELRGKGMHLDGKGTVDTRTGGLVIDALDITQAAASLRIAGSLSKAPAGLAYRLHITGDRAVLEQYVGIFPAAAAFQFGVSPQIDITVSGIGDHVSVRFNRI